MKKVKKILVPTDFTVRSLDAVKEAIERSSEEQLDIVLGFGVKLSSSISDLLFLSKRRLIDTLVSPEYKEMCRFIQSRYQSRIRTMYIDLLSSDQQSYINNYIEGHNIDEIFLPESLQLNMDKRKGFDLAATLRKSIVRQEEQYTPEVSLIHALK